MHTVYVSIGSNLERERNIAGCLVALVAAFGEITTSSVYESVPVGHSGPSYLNLVAAFATDLDPGPTNKILRQIEDDHGRKRGGEKFVDRTLDIDILLFDQLVGEVAGVALPRGEIFEHLHVLHPLAEIAGALTVPGTERSVADIYREFDRGGQEVRRVPFEWQGVELPARLHTRNTKDSELL